MRALDGHRLAMKFILPAVLLSVVLLPLSGMTAIAESSCNIGPMPDATQRLAFAASTWSDLVIIGVVTDETLVEPDYDTPDLTDLKPSETRACPDPTATRPNLSGPTVGIFDVASGALKQCTGSRWAQWSPTVTVLGYLDSGSFKLLDMQTGTTRIVTSGLSKTYDCIYWSPDGRFVVLDVCPRL